MKVIVLGGSGFIGQEIVRTMLARGHQVVGIGRSLHRVRQQMPDADWQAIDIAALKTVNDWRELLDGCEAVVNAAGALQDGARDDLQALQERAMLALYAAAKAGNIRLVVQISANTSGTGADLPFLATKKAADEALKASGLAHVILRPALVIGRNAHGGSALLRALAAAPFVTPLVSANAPVETVALDDVAHTVADAVDGRVTPGTDIALAYPQHHTLGAVVAMHRNWLGLAPARPVSMPTWVARLVAMGADAAGHLGWRSPLRSTALAIMDGGVITQHDSPHELQGASPLKSLEETLSANPAGTQDLWFARLYLLKPVIIFTLAAFWITTGLIALGQFGASRALLEATGLGAGPAFALTLLTSCADIALGFAVLWRRCARAALTGMIVLSLAYLGAATIFTPGLWLDPLGPLVKAIPSMVLAAVGLATFEER